MSSARGKGKGRCTTQERTPSKRLAKKSAMDVLLEPSHLGDDRTHEVVNGEVFFETSWTKPFDMGKLSNTIAMELIRRAPFLLGTEGAQYPKSFFRVTGGLCDSGILYSQLADEDLLPLADLVGVYPMNKDRNRHPLKLITDQRAARDALHLYQRVHGGIQPDNCEFGTKFIRGLALYLGRNKDVDWAGRAADLAAMRVAALVKNPLKLVPACIREQIQQIIDTFTFYLLQAYRSKAVEPKKRKHQSLQSADTSVLEGEEELDFTSMLIPSACKKVGVNKLLLQKRSNLLTAPKPRQRERTTDVVAAAQSIDTLDTKHTPLQTLLDQRRSAEGRLFRLRERLDSLESRLATHARELLQHRTCENSCWDEHAELRRLAKVAAIEGNEEEMLHLESAVKEKKEEASAATEALDATQILLKKSKDEIELCNTQTTELQDHIGSMSEQIEILILENSFLRPQPYMGVLPADPMSSSLAVERPCPSCSCFFVENAFVVCSCGCFFHPHCMFKLLVGSRVVCPRCVAAPLSSWLAQWGINPQPEAIVVDTPATMAQLGYVPTSNSAAANKCTNEAQVVFASHDSDQAASCSWQVGVRKPAVASGAQSSPVLPNQTSSMNLVLGAHDATPMDSIMHSLE